MEVGKVGGRSKDREHLHGGLQCRIGHQRQIDQALDSPPIEGLPDRVVFGLDLLPRRVCRQVNAEQAQARKRAGHRLLVFRLHDMKLELHAVDGRLVDFRGAALQQPHDQLLGFSEVTAQKLALRAFEPQAERQRVLAAPVPFVQQRHAGRKIRARRRIGRRRLGLSPGAQLDRRHLRFLVPVDQPCGAPIELVRDIEQMLGQIVLGHAREQHAADAQMDFGPLLFGNQRISRLLNPVVQEFVGATLMDDEPGGFPERRVHRLLCCPVNQGQGGDLGDIA